MVEGNEGEKFVPNYEIRPGEPETRIQNPDKAHEMAKAEDPRRILARRAKEMGYSEEKIAESIANAEEAGEEAGQKYESLRNQEKVIGLAEKIMLLEPGRSIKIVEYGGNQEDLTDEEIDSLAEFMAAEGNDTEVSESEAGPVKIIKSGLSRSIRRVIIYERQSFDSRELEKVQEYYKNSQDAR
jgi:hypothetical protein